MLLEEIHPWDVLGVRNHRFKVWVTDQNGDQTVKQSKSVSWCEAIMTSSRSCFAYALVGLLVVVVVVCSDPPWHDYVFSSAGITNNADSNFMQTNCNITVYCNCLIKSPYQGRHDVWIMASLNSLFKVGVSRWTPNFLYSGQICHLQYLIHISTRQNNKNARDSTQSR